MKKTQYTVSKNKRGMDVRRETSLFTTTYLHTQIPTMTFQEFAPTGRWPGARGSPPWVNSLVCGGKVNSLSSKHLADSFLIF